MADLHNPSIVHGAAPASSGAPALDARALVAQLASPAALLEGREHVYTAVSDSYRRMIGDRDPLGRTFREVLPEVAAQGFEALLDRVLATGEPVRGSDRVVSWDADGDGTAEEHLVDFLYQPVRDARGEVFAVLAQVTEKREQLWLERERSFLTKASDVLASSLDYDATLAAVTRLAVEGIADWCAVDELRADGSVRRIAVAHPDPEMVRLAHMLQEKYPPDLDAPHGVAYVLRTGQSQLVPEIPDELLVAAARDEEHLRLVRSLGLRSYIVVPLSARGVVLGALSLVASHSGRRFGERHLHLAQELARRAATAIDHARLYRDSERARYALQEQAAELEAQTEELQAQAAQLEEIQSELEASNEELVGANRAAEREQMFAHVLEESLNEIYMFDAETLRFVRVNRGARENLGYTMDELQLLTPLDLKPEYTVEQFGALVEPLRRGTQDVVRFETVHRRKDGSLYPVDVHLQLSRAAEPPLFVALILDITERKQALAERERLFEAEREAREQIQILADAGTLLAASLDPGATLDELARIAVPAIADWCFVEVPTDDGRIVPVAVYHREPERSRRARTALERFPLDPAAEFGTAKVLRTGEPELVPEVPAALSDAVSREEEYLALLHQVGFRSYVSVPLRVRGRVLGVLSLVQAESGRRFGPEDLPFVQELARKAALALDNARLFEEAAAARRRAEQEAERLDRLRRLATALNQAATLEDVARVCVAQGMDAFGAIAGSLALVRDEGDCFEVVHSEGYAAEAAERWRRFPVRRGRPLSDALLQHAPVLVANLAEWRARYPAAATDAMYADLLAFAAIPLVLGERPLGGLSFSFATERAFTEGDRAFLAGFGAQAAQALERARLLETERHARSEAEEANRAKAEFLSTVSHELRTPLNAIGGYVELLELGIHGPVTEAQAQALRRVRRAQEVLLSLINDVLNFARIEAGRLEIAREPVDVSAILDPLGDLVAPQVGAKGIAYRYQAADPDTQVVGDAERIRQILVNLLSNAVKFTDPGGTITLSAERVGDRIAIRVADTGRGIPLDKRERIFDPFVQIDRNRTAESQQGVGLGLAISRELARAMGGEIEVESTVDVGSTFTLTLPAPVASTR